MRSYLSILALATSTLLACQSKSPEEDLLHQADPAGSWIATLRFTGEQWNANNVPASFVETTVDAARDELARMAAAAGKSKARPAVRLPFQRLVTAARSAGAALARAVEAGNRPEVARQVGRLAALQGELAAWRQQEEPR